METKMMPSSVAAAGICWVTGLAMLLAGFWQAGAVLCLGSLVALWVHAKWHSIAGLVFRLMFWTELRRFKIDIIIVGRRKLGVIRWYGPHWIKCNQPGRGGDHDRSVQAD